MTGRSSEYTQDIADRICLRISEGESLRSICTDDDMPAKSTVMGWLARNEHAGFVDQYTRARELQADTLFDDCQDIADDARNDWMEKRNGDDEGSGWALNGEHVQRSRLRIDTRKWMAGKLRPKVYGDKIDVTSGGDKIDFASVIAQRRRQVAEGRNGDEG